MKKNIRYIVFLVSLALIIMGYLYIKSDRVEIYKIEKWDNVYNEESLEFFYEDMREVLIESLDKTYNITKIIEKERSLHEKVLRITDIVKEVVEYDDVRDTNQKSAYAILSERGTSRKVSQKDMAIITRDFITTQGIKARVGEFRSGGKYKEKESNYYIIEYWNEDFNKWVMVDFRDRGFFSNKKIPCSAIEVLQYKIEDFSYIGKSKRSTYLSNIKNSLESYTVAIDNTISQKKSNSYITYLYKDKSCLTMEFKGKFIEPTIFTENKELFNKEPNYKKQENDTKAYLIFMRLYDGVEVEKHENNDNSLEIPNDKMTIGAFKNGKIIDEYYIKVNNGAFELVQKYKEYNFVKGKNTIELSLDGQNIVSTVEILRN